MSMTAQCIFCPEGVEWPSPELVVIGLMWDKSGKDPVIGENEEAKYQQFFAHRECITKFTGPLHDEEAE